MEALIRKVLVMSSRPMVVLVNLWVSGDCQRTRYLLHGMHYDIPIISVCTAVNLCFGRNRLPKFISDLYSTTDGVHPWGSRGVKFISDLIFAWWRRMRDLTVEYAEVNSSPHSARVSDSKLLGRHKGHKRHHRSPTSLQRALGTRSPAIATALPLPLYAQNPIGLCTRCDALADDADHVLEPVTPPKGFRVVTR